MARRAVLTGPWRPPVFLALATGLFLLWWLLPIALAVRTSFTAGDLPFRPEGFSLSWYGEVLREGPLRRAFVQSLGLGAVTALVATPLGTAMALGLHHVGGAAARGGRGLALLAMATPQAALGAALFFVFASMYDFVPFSTPAQALAHVTLALPFVVLIVQVRLLGLDPHYEEMAMDLGASPLETQRRVMLPLLVPALVASAAVAFFLSFDNIVLSGWLCIPEDCRTVPVVLYGRGAIAPQPEDFALATLAVVVSLAAAGATFWSLRAWSRHARSARAR